MAVQEKEELGEEERLEGEWSTAVMALVGIMGRGGSCIHGSPSSSSLKNWQPCTGGDLGAKEV